MTKEKGKSDSEDDNAKNSSAEDKENKTTEKGTPAENLQFDVQRSPVL